MPVRVVMMEPMRSAPSAEPLFQLDGGRVCLDFANTQSVQTGEHLGGYADLVAFATQSGLLTPRDAEWLHAESLREPQAAEAVLERARGLRGAMYALFSAIAGGGAPRDADLETLNAELAVSFQHACVERDGAAFRWGWRGRELDMPLWGICRSASDLLVSDEVRRVRECGATDCRWLFLDTSKNRSRQWCSMQECGNRQKARRHYQRVRALR